MLSKQYTRTFAVLFPYLFSNQICGYVLTVFFFFSCICIGLHTLFLGHLAMALKASPKPLIAKAFYNIYEFMTHVWENAKLTDIEIGLERTNHTNEREQMTNSVYFSVILLSERKANCIYTFNTVHCISNISPINDLLIHSHPLRPPRDINTSNLYCVLCEWSPGCPVCPRTWRACRRVESSGGR